ncbi:MAG: DUF5596 domain-containing protein [Clostridiaceae bacterium]|nr:DUF5596 domain-containing protein [Clostridiaceae bacterium]
MNSLKLSKYPMRWNSIFEKAMEKYELNGCELADERKLREINDKYCVFTRYFDKILMAAKLIRENERLSRFLTLLGMAMSNRSVFIDDLKLLELPKAQSGIDPLGYDLVSFFVFPVTIPATYAKYRNHNVPENIIRKTLEEYEDCIMGYELRNGKVGFDTVYLSWGQLIVDSLLLRVGRFNFELLSSFKGGIRVFRNSLGEVKVLADGIRLHRSGAALGSPKYKDDNGAYNANFVETDEYWEGYPIIEGGVATSQRIKIEKRYWKPILQKGDPVISVHIPPNEDFSPENCEKSYIEANRIIKRCYPDFKFKAFVCYSWLMDPQLEYLLKPDSNIIAFQKKFIRFPTVSSGNSVFYHVFLKKYERLQDLPENTSLQRALKKHYFEGNYIYDLGGFFLA